MSKRRISATAVHTTDWMMFRAYPRFLPSYDGFYLRLSNTVFTELNDPERFFRNMLQRDQMVELAVVLVSWFEDYANEIGLWNTYTRKNMELYGYRLPFFQADDYDPEAMNQADIAYLCWHYCGKVAETFISPDSPALEEIAEVLLELFDEALDMAPGTDLYDDFLTFNEDIPFFDLKTKLYWITFQSYLNGPEFKRMLQNALLELAEDESELLSKVDDPGKLVYAMQDDYLYKKSSSFLAFTAPEWLAEVARCPEELRDDIRRLFRRVPGEFVYEDADERFYHFRHAYTKRLFDVRRESVELKGISPGYMVFAYLVNWRGEWWVTGTLSGMGEAKNEEAKLKKEFDPSSVSFYAWDEARQQQMRDLCAEMEAAHLEFFDGPLTFFHHQKELEAALQDWQKFFAGKKDGGKPAGSLLSRLLPARRRAPTAGASAFMQSPAALPQGRGIAAYFEPGEGVLMSPLVVKLAWALEQPSLEDSEAKPVFFDLFSQCSPSLARCLVDRFSARNLRFPVKTAIPLMPHFDFLLRFYNPGDFREVLPNNTLLPEAD